MLMGRWNLIAMLISASFGWNAAAVPFEQVRGNKREAMEPDAKEEAQARKSKSEVRLKSESVPVNAGLPAIETESESSFRTGPEILQRALCLIVVALKGEGLEKAYLDSLIREYDLTGSFTPEERAFIGSKSFGKSDKIKFTWKYEPATVLMWSIGLIPTLDRPVKICDVPLVVNILKSGTRKGLLAKAKLKGKKEILDEADLIYRYHWATRDAELNGKAAPGGLDPGVVYERHYALNWLIGYLGQAWDDVTTDT